LTFSELNIKAKLMARNLLRLGLKKGDRFAVIFPNTHELLVTYFATALIGVIHVPLDPEYGPHDLAYILEITEPTAIMFYNSKEFEPFVNDFFPDLNSFKKSEYKSSRFVNLKYLIQLEPLDKSQIGKDLRDTWKYDQFANSELNETNFEFPYVDSDDIFAILFPVIKRFSLEKIYLKINKKILILFLFIILVLNNLKAESMKNEDFFIF
jgi:acyl-CoA synthetase (AMP-forming)/AMP-acid ligase II